MAKPAKTQLAKRPVAVSSGNIIPISQPSSRLFVQWSPALLRQVLRRTESGDMTLLADLCDQLIADDRFGELLGQLADDVLGCDLSFEKTMRSTVGNAEKSAELEDDWPVGYDDDELKSIIVWTMLTGVGFAKHEAWIETPDKRVVPALKWWHPQHFSFLPSAQLPVLPGNDLRNHRWHVRQPDGSMKPIEAGDGEWVIVTRRSEYRPWASGLWRGLAVWWLLKQYAMQDSGIHTEKASKLVATSTGDTGTAEERKALAQYVYDSGKDAVVVLPQGYTMALLEVRANLDELYHSQIRLADEAASLAILGQNLSTKVSGGSLAATKEHSKKESRRVRNAAQMLTKNLQSQSLIWWAEFNFGDRQLAPYPRFHTDPEEDYSAKAMSLSTLSTALLTLKTAGWEIDEDTVEEEYGVTLKKTKALEAHENAEPGDPDGDGIPHNEPGNVGKDQPAGGAPLPDPKGDTPPKAAPPRQRPSKPKKPTPPPDNPATALLASGDDPSKAAGFVRGQIYTDALTDKQVKLVAGELSPFVDRLLAAINGASDYEDVRYRVIKTFQDEADPDRLSHLVERGILLADLAGRYAVNEDVPKDG